MAKKIIDMKPYYIGGDPEWIDVKKFLKGRRILIHPNENDVIIKTPPTGIIMGFLNHAAPIEYLKAGKVGYIGIRYLILILVKLDPPIDIIDYNDKKLHLENIILRTEYVYDAVKDLIENGKTTTNTFCLEALAPGKNPWDINLDYFTDIFPIAKGVDIEIIE